MIEWKDFLSPVAFQLDFDAWVINSFFFFFSVIKLHQFFYGVP